MQRIQPLRERLKPLGPVHRKLFLEQLLGSRNILDPGETVILAEIAQSFPVHAAAQPFAAIDANVNAKREPGLHLRMHPAEFRVYAVVVNRQTGARTDHHVRLVMLECRRHLHRAQSAYIPLGNAPLGSESAGDFLFLVATVDILDQQVLLLKRLQGRLLDLLAHCFHMIFVVLAEDVVFDQIPLHSLGVVEPPQRTAKQHPIKAGHHTLDLFLEFGDKLLHGVSPWFLRCGFGHPTTYTLGGTPISVCGLPPCGAAWQPAADWQPAPAGLFTTSAEFPFVGKLSGIGQECLRHTVIPALAPTGLPGKRRVGWSLRRPSAPPGCRRWARRAPGY